MKPRILYNSFRQTIACNGLPIDTKKYFFFRCLLNQDLFLFNIIEHPKVEDNIAMRWLMFANKEDKTRVKTLTKICEDYLDQNHYKAMRNLGGYCWRTSIKELTMLDEYRFSRDSDVVEIRKVVKEMVMLPLLDIEFTGDIGYGVDV